MPGGFPLGMDVCNASDNGTQAASSNGKLVTAGAGGAYGSWTQIVASTPSDACYLLVILNENFATAESGILDIGVGAAASEVVVATGLICSTNIGANKSATYSFPVSIPSGSRIAARAKALGIGDVIAAIVYLFDGAYTNMDGMAGVDALGLSANAGTVLTGGGSANTKGSYSQLIASTAVDYAGFFLGFDNANNSSVATLALVDIAIGAGGSETVVLPNVLVTIGADPVGADGFFVPIAIPSGTRVAARMQSTVASQKIGLTVYGVYQ